MKSLMLTLSVLVSLSAMAAPPVPVFVPCGPNDDPAKCAKQPDAVEKATAAKELLEPRKSYVKSLLKFRPYHDMITALQCGGNPSATPPVPATSCGLDPKKFDSWTLKQLVTASQALEDYGAEEKYVASDPTEVKLVSQQKKDTLELMAGQRATIDFTRDETMVNYIVLAVDRIKAFFGEMPYQQQSAPAPIRVTEAPPQPQIIIKKIYVKAKPAAQAPLLAQQPTGTRDSKATDCITRNPGNPAAQEQCMTK